MRLKPIESSRFTDGTMTSDVSKKRYVHNYSKLRQYSMSHDVSLSRLISIQRRKASTHSLSNSFCSLSKLAMSIHRIGLRLGQPCRQQQRLMNTTTTTLRSATRRTPNTTTSTTLPSGQWGFIQRRFASKNIDLQGFPDNSFNRERAAVKAHAAATSGMDIE